jgi:hypothetical protein
MVSTARRKTAFMRFVSEEKGVKGQLTKADLVKREATTVFQKTNTKEETQ